MTIRHLRIFTEVARCCNMSEAAVKLFISQPTVSQAIRELEEHYGLLLFERRARHLFITEPGRKLLTLAANALEQFDQLEAAMMETGLKKKIRIGATITVGNSIINDVLEEFKEKMPEVESFICVSNTAAIEEKLLSADLDLGIIEGKVKSPELISIPAVNDYLVLACSKNHPFARRKTLELHEIEAEKFHMREEGSGTREQFEDYLNAHGIHINVVFESNCPSAIKRTILENNQLSVLSVRLVEEEARSGQIHLIKPDGPAWERNFSIVYHRDKVINENMQTLIDIVESFKDHEMLKGFAITKLIDDKAREDTHAKKRS